MHWGQLIFQRYRVNIGVSLIVLLALVSMCNEIRLFYQLRGSDWNSLSIVYFEHRYDKLLPYVPSTGLFGYISDTKDPVKSDIEYILSIYCLAPRLLQKSDQPELIIGNFHTLPINNKTLIEQGLILLKDCGDGVLLLTRRLK
jgi:hypothetical protein